MGTATETKSNYQVQKKQFMLDNGICIPKHGPGTKDQQELQGQVFIDPLGNELIVDGHFYDSSDPCDYEWVVCHRTDDKYTKFNFTGWPVRVVKNCLERDKAKAKQPKVVKAADVAVEFSRVLIAWLTPKEMAKVLKDNAAEPKGSTVCHSHDYCDANMAMLQALGKVMVCDGEPDITDEAVQAVFNEAWTIAKANNFYLKKG